LATGRFTSTKDMIASTAVGPTIWRTLTHPRAAGYRNSMGGGNAINYDKVALLAEAVGIHPPVVWLGYNLCEGPIYNRRKDPGKPGRWSKPFRDAVLRACADLTTIGGAYAEQVPALLALANGETPAPLGNASWQQPARTLIALERQRLTLDSTPATPPA
jgi:hypothetical protein